MEFLFTYKGYTARFGNLIRPALVRKVKLDPNSYPIPVKHTVYIDGKSEDFILQIKSKRINPYSIVLLKPLPTSNAEQNDDKLQIIRFNPDSQKDWGYLISETHELHRQRDPLDYALLAIALDAYDWKTDILKAVLDVTDIEIRNVILDRITFIAWALSPDDISRIKELNNHFSKDCQVCFPPFIERAANNYEIPFANFNVYKTTTLIFAKSEITNTKDNTGFNAIINWLKDDNAQISHYDLEASFPYLDGMRRNLAVKRFFYDVKKGNFKFNDETLKIFDTQNYHYHSTLRYIFTTWPNGKDVSTDFLFDCLQTYKNTKESSFQIHDGILDCAMKKSIQLMRPLDLRFHEWMAYCEGGIVLNKEFKGFADFEIKYEFNDFAFDQESLTMNFEAIRNRYSMKSSDSDEEKWEILPLDAEREHLTTRLNEATDVNDIKYLNEALDIHKKTKSFNKSFIDIFIDWSKRPDGYGESIFNMNMLQTDADIVRRNVEKYLHSTYQTDTPYISERKTDIIVKMFMYGSKMRAVINNSAVLYINPDLNIGISDWDTKVQVRNRLCELFGNKLECDYDPAILKKAQRDSLYRYDGKNETCLTRSKKRYNGKLKTYCSPSLSESTLLITGRRYAICNGEMCFKTCLTKDPHWKNIGLLHILDIIGYEVFEDTEAGYFANSSYRRFINQINKAIRFYKSVVCRECGHILFPAHEYGQARFKCVCPTCTEYSKEVYINNCFNCKKGLIDSRDTSKCPNGTYICPECSSCCSNAYYESLALRYTKQGKAIPKSISMNIGKGHADINVLYCSKCGSQKVYSGINKSGEKEYTCPKCGKSAQTN